MGTAKPFSITAPLSKGTAYDTTGEGTVIVKSPVSGFAPHNFPSFYVCVYVDIVTKNDISRIVVNINWQL